MEDTIENLTEKLDSLKEQIKVTQEELKVLIAKRIESINYFNEIKYRESNLRRKYAELGLNYE
jgi:uncharacterized coiled-coil DUF342 family protein